MLKDVIGFARKSFSKSSFKRLEIHFFENCSDYVSGVACSEKPTKSFKPASKKSKYFILIWIGRTIKYPHCWIYRKRAGGKYVYNKKEAIIQTLAHEFFHIESWVLNRAIYFEEVEAERKAHKVLKDFKKEY